MSLSEPLWTSSYDNRLKWLRLEAQCTYSGFVKLRPRSGYVSAVYLHWWHPTTSTTINLREIGWNTPSQQLIVTHIRYCENINRVYFLGNGDPFDP